MSTTCKFLGWVQGRAHSNPPTEMTGYPLAHTTLSDVRVTGYFPALAGNKEVIFQLDTLHKDDFQIGSAITLTVEAAPAPVAEQLGDPVVAAEQARAAVAAGQVVSLPEAALGTNNSEAAADAPVVEIVGAAVHAVDTTPADEEAPAV